MLSTGLKSLCNGSVIGSISILNIVPDTREVKFFSVLRWCDPWVDMARLPVFNGLQQIMERAELDITAQLARFELSDEEIQRFEQAVFQMLEYFSKMKELGAADSENSRPG